MGLTLSQTHNLMKQDIRCQPDHSLPLKSWLVTILLHHLKIKLAQIHSDDNKPLKITDCFPVNKSLMTDEHTITLVKETKQMVEAAEQ